MQRPVGLYTGATDMMTKEQGETLNIGHFVSPSSERLSGRRFKAIWMR